MRSEYAFRQRAIAVIVVYALVLAGCGGGIKTNVPLQPGASAFPQPTGYNAYTPEQEVQLGQQVAQQADAQLPLLPPRNPVSDYISTLGTRLARNLPDNPYQFNFKVVNQKEINAFALPGGPVRVNLGTLQAADNEAQIAGVIAHEISHVYMRHSTRQASKAQFAEIPAAILGGVLGQGTAGQLARLGLEVGLGSVFLKYSRDAEREADYVGAKLMYEAGYDPRAMAQFFEKLASEDRAGGPQFLSDHPNPGNRADAVMQAISQLPPKKFQTNSPLFTEAKAAAAKMKPYTGQQIAQMAAQKQSQQQVNSGSIQPSGSFQQLSNDIFQMAYPSNWKAYSDPKAPVVTIAPPGGMSSAAIAYGTVVGLYQPPQRLSLQQSAEHVFESLRQSNPQLQPASQLQPAEVSGLNAVAVQLRGPSPLTSSDGQPIAERDMLVAVQRPDGSVLWLLFIAPEQDFNKLSATFQQMLQSLRVA
jgi:hypothetical protein